MVTTIYVWQIVLTILAFFITFGCNVYDALDQEDTVMALYKAFLISCATLCICLGMATIFTHTPVV